jgi:hypothetical protein
MQELLDYLTGSLSATGATIITYPLDYLKISYILK